MFYNTIKTEKYGQWKKVILCAAVTNYCWVSPDILTLSVFLKVSSYSFSVVWLFTVAVYYSCYHLCHTYYLHCNVTMLFLCSAVLAYLPPSGKCLSVSVSYTFNTFCSLTEHFATCDNSNLLAMRTITVRNHNQHYSQSHQRTSTGLNRTG